MELKLASLIVVPVVFRTNTREDFFQPSESAFVSFAGAGAGGWAAGGGG
jgi:hypothetical protein